MLDASATVSPPEADVWVDAAAREPSTRERPRQARARIRTRGSWQQSSRSVRHASNSGAESADRLLLQERDKLGERLGRGGKLVDLLI
jgi:hypothetical protein